MSTTLKSQRDYIRSFYGLKANEFNNTILTKFINIAQPNVQIDLIKHGIGIDDYIKTADLAFDLNEVTSSSVGSGDCAIMTPSAHGYTAGEYIIWGKDSEDVHPELQGEYLITNVVSSVIFQFKLNVIDGFWGDGWISKGYAVLPSDLLDMDDAILTVEGKYKAWDALAGILESGSSYTYVPISEKTLTDGVNSNMYNSNSNIYEKPDTVEPYWWIAGSKSGAKVIHVNPVHLESLRIRYRYKAAALSADADLLIVPDEHTDLIRKYCKRLIEEKRGNLAERDKAIADYDKDIKQLMEKYGTGKNTKQAEKQETKVK